MGGSLHSLALKSDFLHFVPRRILLHCWPPEEERYVSRGREHAKPGEGRFHLRKNAAPVVAQRYQKVFSTESKKWQRQPFIPWFSRQPRFKVTVKFALTNLSGIFGLHSGKGLFTQTVFLLARSSRGPL